jgi:hypothetical protein
MKKGTYLFSMVGLLALGSLAEAISGFILWFALPSGGGRGRLELTSLGLTRHTWVDIHDWAAIALTVLVIVHFILHWKWVVQMCKRIFTTFTESYREMKGAATLKTN